MNNSQTSAILAILSSNGIEIPKGKLTKVTNQLDMLGDPMIQFHEDHRVVKRTLLANGLSYKEVSNALGCDSGDVTIQLGIRVELGDTKGAPIWNASKLKDSKYAKNKYSKEQLERMYKYSDDKHKSWEGLRQYEDLLIAKDGVDAPELAVAGK